MNVHIKSYPMVYNLLGQSHYFAQGMNLQACFNNAFFDFHKEQLILRSIIAYKTQDI